ncbi:MAG: hypothetical protein AAGB19_07795 [Cyanobacteria bacterium P01_F01_bin.3]
MAKRNGFRALIHVLMGMLAVCLGHFLYFIGVVAATSGLEWLGWLVMDIFDYMALMGALFCLVIVGQLIYVRPLYRYFRRKGYPNAANGVVIAALITVLLGGGCFLVLLPFLLPS